MVYEKEIVKILKEAGPEGLSVAKITRHVFNATNSFFAPIEKSDIQGSIQRYLLSQSKSPTGIVCKVGWGKYRLNMKSKNTLDILSRLSDGSGEQPRDSSKDMSLSLFW